MDAGQPEVCLEVEEIDYTVSWTTVVVFGRYDEIHQSSAESAARGRAEQLFSARQGGGCLRRRRLRGATTMTSSSVGIQIERLTGRRTAPWCALRP